MKNGSAFFLSTLFFWTTLAGVLLACLFNAYVSHPFEASELFKVAAFAGMITGGMATLMLYFMDSRQKKNDGF